MICKEIMAVLERAYPKGAALSFDNVGLLAGRSSKEIHRIYLALDATEEVIRQAKEAKADMLITHHPLLFSPLKSVTDEDFVGRRMVELIQADMSYYAMHTNYDVLGMADLAARILELDHCEVLNVTAEINDKAEGIGKVGSLSNTMTLQECCTYVKNKLKLSSVKVFGDFAAPVTRLAVSPGSGKGAVQWAIEAKADVLVTGDIGHHEGIDANEQGLHIIDAGHYGTEYIFLDDIQSFLKREIPAVEVLAAPVLHPFQVI